MKNLFLILTLFFIFSWTTVRSVGMNDGVMKAYDLDRVSNTPNTYKDRKEESFHISDDDFTNANIPIKKGFSLWSMPKFDNDVDASEVAWRKK